MLADEVHFCPRCGSGLQSAHRAGRLRPVCPQCGWIFFPDPKVAVAMLVEKHNSVLLVQRVNQPQQGLWSLPAGFVDAGEDPARAAERECLEECGLHVRAADLLGIIAEQEHPAGAHILIVYRGELEGGQLQAGDDAAAAGFFERSQLPTLAFASTQRILDYPVND